MRDAGFVVQLEVRSSALSRYADVVLPIAPPTKKSGTYLSWEGRPRPFAQVFATSARSDAQVLEMLARAMDVELGVSTLEAIHRELAEVAAWDGARVEAPAIAPASPSRGDGESDEVALVAILDASS